MEMRNVLGLMALATVGFIGYYMSYEPRTERECFNELYEKYTDAGTTSVKVTKYERITVDGFKNYVGYFKLINDADGTTKASGRILCEVGWGYPGGRVKWD